MGIRAILFLLWFFPSLPICFAQPFYGIVVWTILAFLNPQWYAWGVSYLVPWALAVAVPTIGGFLIFGRGLSKVVTRETTLLFVLWIWFTVTTLVSTSSPVFQHHADDTWERWNFVSKIFLMTFVTVGVVDSFSRLRILVLTIAGCLGVFVAKTLPFMIATGGQFRVYGPEKSMMADNNDFGLALNMTLPLFFFLAQSESRRWLRRVFGALFLMNIPAIFFTYSRGALVGLIAVLALMLMRVKQRVILIPVIMSALLIAILFAPEGWQQRMDLTGQQTMDGSAMSRINAWKFSWHLANDYPITGGGFDTFTARLFDQYADRATDIKGPHSIYFGVLAEHGFVGLALYLVLIGSCFVSTSHVIKWARFHGDEIVVNYANMFRFSLVGFLTSGLFLGRMYFDYLYTIIACIAILRRVCFLKWAAERQEDLDNQEEEEEFSAPLPSEAL